MKPIRKLLVIGAPLLLTAEMCGAIGYQGFVPTDSNVLVPSTGAVASAWKQVGACGSSAVQISPSWVLSAHHSHCAVGVAFRRVHNGVQNSIKVTWSKAFPDVDLHLSRLETPMPYSGEFVPLVYGWREKFVGEDVKSQLAIYPGADVLGVGYGVDSTGVRKLQAGWAPLGSLDDVGTNRANPRLGHPSSSNGDSGGGLFLYGHNATNGVLAGVLQFAHYLPGGSKGIHVDIKQQIESILSDPVTNPTGERVEWVSMDQALGAPQNPIPSAVNYENTGMTLLGANPAGFFTSSSPSTLKIQMPKGVDFRRTPDETGLIDQYVVRLVHEKHMAATNYTLSTEVNAFVNELNIGSGVIPGKWYGTVHGRVFDPATGVTRDGLARRVVFDVPENADRPKALKAVEISQLDRLDLGGSFPHWCAELTPVVGGGVEPEGVIWKLSTPTGPVWSAFPMTEKGGFCSTWLSGSENGPKPGTSFEVTAQPFRGVAVGPVTTVKIVVPTETP